MWENLVILAKSRRVMPAIAFPADQRLPFGSDRPTHLEHSSIVVITGIGGPPLSQVELRKQSVSPKDISSARCL